jgi:hypothetical protein
MAHTKAKLKAVEVKDLLVRDHSEGEMIGQIFTHVNFTTGFI